MHVNWTIECDGEPVESGHAICNVDPKDPRSEELDAQRIRGEVRKRMGELSRVKQGKWQIVEHDE